MNSEFDGLDNIIENNENENKEIYNQNPFEENVPQEKNENNNLNDKHQELLKEISYLRGRIESQNNGFQNNNQNYEQKRKSLYEDDELSLSEDDKSFLNGSEDVISKLIKSHLNNYHNTVGDYLEKKIDRTSEFTKENLKNKFYEGLKSKTPDYEKFHSNYEFTNSYLNRKVPFGGGITYNEALNNAFAKGDHEAASEIYGGFKKTNPPNNYASPGSASFSEKGKTYQKNYSAEKVNAYLDDLAYKAENSKSASDRDKYNLEYKKARDRMYEEISKGNIR